MFKVKTEKYNDLGFYQMIIELELIKDLKARMGYLNMRTVGKDWRPNQNCIITPCFKGEQVQLLLTTISNMPVSVLYLVRADQVLITNHRFQPALYSKNIVLFGDLFQNTLVVHCVSFGDKNEKTADTIEKLDAILFNKLKEDLDLEPIQVSLKEFYETENEIPWCNEQHKAVLYLNPIVKGQHFIKFK